MKTERFDMISGIFTGFATIIGVKLRADSSSIVMNSQLGMFPRRSRRLLQRCLLPDHFYKLGREYIQSMPEGFTAGNPTFEWRRNMFAKRRMALRNGPRKQ